MVGSWEFAQQKALHCATTRHATAEQPRRKDARVVEHQQVAGSQVVLEVPERGVLDRTFASREHQQPRPSTHGRGALCDQFVGKLEVEITNS